MKTTNKGKLKFKVWDEFGKPIDKFKAEPKDVTKRIKCILKKYN